MAGIQGINKRDITGQRFGRLVAIEDVTVPSFGNKEGRRWLFDCDCGNSHTAPAKAVVTKRGLKSCGCLQKEAAARNCVSRSTHGLTGTRIVGIYRGMLARCDNPSHISYPYYGALGITVCEEWRKGVEPFWNWAKENGYRDDLTIDRIKNEEGYYPENCRWATYTEQARNRTNNLLLKFNGETKPVSEWSEISGVNSTTILYRNHAGWPDDVAIWRPEDHGKRYIPC